MWIISTQSDNIFITLPTWSTVSSCYIWEKLQRWMASLIWKEDFSGKWLPACLCLIVMRSVMFPGSVSSPVPPTHFPWASFLCSPAREMFPREPAIPPVIKHPVIFVVRLLNDTLGHARVVSGNTQHHAVSQPVRLKISNLYILPSPAPRGCWLECSQ